jgi:hypothetical protein
MTTMLAGRWLRVVCLSCFLFAVAGTARAAGVDLKALKSIAIPEQPAELEKLATTLAGLMKEAYGVDLQVVKTAAPGKEPAILLDRTLAIGSGMISRKELDDVKYDGYVIKAADNRIAVSGFRTRGTRYGVYALLRRIGLAFYPWNNDSAAPLKVVTPLADTQLAEFSISDKPFFIWRQTGGMLDIWGQSNNDTGDVQRAANQDLFNYRTRKPDYNKYNIKSDDDWPDSQHSAAYLIPRDLYHETHPEYYAMHNGKRDAPAVYARTPLCLTNRDVWRITTQRALEWMGMQRDRRFFWIADSDAPACQCPECLQADYQPGYDGDRMLTWVNNTAKAVAAKFPDNVVLTMGYANSCWPPLHVKPEPNVRVLYAPWYWDARGAPAGSFFAPRNIIAMEQYIGWNMTAPGQVGLYAYPNGDYLWLGGLAQDLRWLAKNNSRLTTFCGETQICRELAEYVFVRLAWDPCADISKSEEEFCRTYYGPAADAMLQFFALDTATALKNAGVYEDPEYQVKAPALLRHAEALAASDEAALHRLHGHVLGWLERFIPAICPVADKPTSAEQYQEFRNALGWYQRDNSAYIATCPKYYADWTAKHRGPALANLLKKCGLQEVQVGQTEDEATLMNRARAYFDDVAKRAMSAAKPVEEEKVVSAKFDTAAAVRGCQLDATQAELISPPIAASIRCPDGEEIQGVKVALPLTRLKEISLPYRADGINKMHAGRFLLTSQFSTPLDATGCRYLEFRFYASQDIPVSIYLDFPGSSGQYADFRLHAGQQIVRIDLNNFNRLDQKKWDQKINGVKVDFWPQDNLFPYPATRDAEVVLAEVTARSYVPAPADLPHAGKAVWLVQDRANHTFKFFVSNKDWQLSKQKNASHYEHGGTYWMGERFRSSTLGRAFSPIFAIVSDAEDREAAQAVQDYLGRMYGAKLPVNPAGVTAGPGLGNVVIVGMKAALASGRVTQKELDYVGPDGFVVRAHQGRIVLAGGSPGSAGFPLARYLEDHGVHFSMPGVKETVPDLKGTCLHELYIPDHPYFKNRPVAGGWKLMTRVAAKAGETPARSTPATLAAAERIADAIKDCARRNKEIPAALADKANATALGRYVAAKLLWDPFQDTSALIKQFQAEEKF